jgi:hypothetical protein
LVADWLREGGSVPPQSFMQITDADGEVVKTLLLEAIALGKSQ